MCRVRGGRSARAVLTTMPPVQQGGCGDFYKITVVSSRFAGVPLVKQHRMVNDVLKAVLPQLHGITLHTSAPSSKAPG